MFFANRSRQCAFESVPKKRRRYKGEWRWRNSMRTPCMNCAIPGSRDPDRETPRQCNRRLGGDSRRRGLRAFGARQQGALVQGPRDGRIRYIGVCRPPARGAADREFPGCQFAQHNRAGLLSAAGSLNQLSFLARSATRLPNSFAVSKSPMRGASSTEASAGETAHELRQNLKTN